MASGKAIRLNRDEIKNTPAVHAKISDQLEIGGNDRFENEELGFQPLHSCLRFPLLAASVFGIHAQYLRNFLQQDGGLIFYHCIGKTVHRIES